MSSSDINFVDVLRVLHQRERLAEDGFEFQNMSGTLNLLGFWKATGGNLVPEHLLDIRPPILMMLPTDALLALRIDGDRRRDLHTLPLPQGGATAVERMQRSDDDMIQPIYVSLADVRAVRFSAAVVKDGRVWWLDFGTAPQESREWRYRCLHAALQWVEAVGQAVATRFPKVFPGGVRRVRVVVPNSNEIDRASASQFSTPIIDTLVVKQTPEGGIVEILPEWLPYLGSGLIDQSQKRTAAAMQIAEK